MEAAKEVCDKCPWSETTSDIRWGSNNIGRKPRKWRITLEADYRTLPRIVLDRGGAPPQPHVPCNLDEQEMLLYVAWAHSMQDEDVVHRSVVFAFIQSHLARRSVEPLQRAIENSQNWKCVGKGAYRISSNGLLRLKALSEQASCGGGIFLPSHMQRCGRNIIPPRMSTECAYSFTRTFADMAVQVRVSPSRRELAVTLNGRSVTGVDACAKLKEKGAYFAV